jgi:hypothetical protein
LWGLGRFEYYSQKYEGMSHQSRVEELLLNVNEAILKGKNENAIDALQSALYLANSSPEPFSSENVELRKVIYQKLIDLSREDLVQKYTQAEVEIQIEHNRKVESEEIKKQEFESRNARQRKIFLTIFGLIIIGVIVIFRISAPRIDSKHQIIGDPLESSSVLNSPWRDPSSSELVDIGRALVAKKIGGCGVIKIKTVSSGEWYVACSPDGEEYWKVYVVYKSGGVFLPKDIVLRKMMPPSGNLWFPN